MSDAYACVQILDPDGIARAPVGDGHPLVSRTFTVTLPASAAKALTAHKKSKRAQESASFTLTATTANGQTTTAKTQLATITPIKA